MSVEENVEGVGKGWESCQVDCKSDPKERTEGGGMGGIQGF